MKGKKERRAYAVHGLLDVLDVVQADGAVHDPLGMVLHALGSGERRGSVLREGRRSREAEDVEERVPGEDQKGPEPQEERESTAGVELAGRERAPGLVRDGGEGVGVGGLAGAGEEERHE